MKAQEIIKEINENGGLDMGYISYAARKDNCSIREYIRCYVKNSYCCSNYIANKVTDYFC